MLPSFLPALRHPPTHTYRSLGITLFLMTVRPCVRVANHPEYGFPRKFPFKQPGLDLSTYENIMSSLRAVENDERFASHFATKNVRYLLVE